MNIKNKVSLHTTKGLLKAIGVAFLCIVAFFAFINRDNLSPRRVAVFWNDKIASLGQGPNYPVHIVGNGVNSHNFKKVDNSISYLSDTAFVSLNNSAKEISNQQHSFSNPILKVNGNDILLFDLYGTKAIITSKSKVTHNVAKDENIISAAIASNGKYALTTTVKGYASKLAVFNEKQDDSYYEYCFSDCYVTDVCFSKNNKQVATVGLTSTDGEMQSSLYVFDCRSETPLLKLDFNNNMLFYVGYTDANHIVVLGDNIFSVVDVKSKKRQDYNFENKTLTAYDINEEGAALSLSLSEDGNACEILLFDKHGHMHNNIKTDLKINSVSYNYSRVAAASYGKAYLYKKSGKCVKGIYTGKDSREIILCSSKQAYVLGFTEVRKINF